MADQTPITDHRVERVLAFMVAAAIGLSVIAFLSVIIGTGVGVREFSSGVWPVVIVMPAIGLPIGLMLMIALLIVSAQRRGREARDARK